MKIIEPKAELWIQGNPKEHVAKCASVCYASAEKKGEKAEKFYNALVNSGHVSMLRHESVYYKVPENARLLDHNSIDDKDYDPDDYFRINFLTCPYVDYMFKNGYWYVATNGNFVLDNPFYIMSALEEYKITSEEFKIECPELMRYTICITTQISTTRELNRCKLDNCIA